MTRLHFRLLVTLTAALFFSSGSQAARLSSAHFRYTYDEQQLSRAAAETAAQDAERAYDYNEERFSTTGPAVIECDFTPRFFGATGFAQPDRRPPRVAVRILDLDYLGLDEAYVLRHEVAHIFSGRLASGPMGEGLADLIAGGSGDLPLSSWWGDALQDAGLWVNPDGLFITGDYPASAELDARQRTASYTEPALLLQYLSDRYGLDRVLRFLPDYSRARRTLDSNETGARRPGFRRPDARAVRNSFERHFGRSWDELRAGWEQRIDAGGGSEADRRRLVLGQKTYGAIRNFEMWLLQHRGRADSARAAEIRRAFTAVNGALRARQFDEAESRLRIAQGLVNDLKRPMMITRAFSLVVGVWIGTFGG
jgi:hypothetical protein